jgi:hypothetical protein
MNEVLIINAKTLPQHLIHFREVCDFSYFGGCDTYFSKIADRHYIGISIWFQKEYEGKTKTTAAYYVSSWVARFEHIIESLAQKYIINNFLYK